jgi:N-acetylglutamate synthase-like GNAT family acetyltransferase
MGEIIVTPVVTKKQLKQFVEYPNKLYRKNPFYVPYMYGDEMKMLDPKFNVTLADCVVKYFLAWREKEIVGRVGVILQKKYNAINQTNGVRFTRFDLIDDSVVAKALLDEVEKFAKEYQADYIFGPFGYNETDRSAYLCSGYDRMGNFGTNYNFEYYDKLLLENGYVDHDQWVEFDICMKPETKVKMKKLAEYACSQGHYHISEEKTFKAFAQKWGWKAFQCLNEAYADLPGFVPFEKDLYESIAKQYTLVVKPEWLTVVIDETDNVVGFAICFPSLAKTMQNHGGKLFPFGFIQALHDIAHPKIVDLCLIGVTPAHQGRGVNAILIAHILDAIERHHIEKAQTYAMHEDNTRVQTQWKHFETSITKQRKAVIKFINPNVTKV